MMDYKKAFYGNTRELLLDSKNLEIGKFDNGAIIAKDCLDLHKHSKVKNLIWGSNKMSENEILENIKDEMQELQIELSNIVTEHEESADFWRFIYVALIFTSIFALSISLSYSSQAVTGWLLKVMGEVMIGILSIASGAITVILIFLSPNEKYLSHKNTINKLTQLKDEIKIFLINQEGNIQEYKVSLTSFYGEKNAILEHSLPTSNSVLISIKNFFIR